MLFISAASFSLFQNGRIIVPGQKIPCSDKKHEVAKHGLLPNSDPHQYILKAYLAYIYKQQKQA